jgi:hypothetical protein
VKTPCASLALLIGGWLAAAPAAPVTEEVPMGYLPTEWATSTLKKTLSPQGKFVLINAGPVRITDEPEKVEAARHALEALQKAPSIVPMDLAFVTFTRRTEQRLPVEPPVSDRGFPYPTRFDPPRVIMNGNNVTIIPSQPRDFTTRRVGTGADVNLSPGGYATTQPEVRLSETSTTGTVLRRFTASTVPGRSLAFHVLPQVKDPAALRALALKLGAIAETEPAWPAAATELRVDAQVSEGALVVNLVPVVVLAGGRTVPIRNCAAAVLLARSAPSNKGLLPRADAEFYRLFFGSPQAADDTFTTLTVKAQLQYVGNPPQ